MWTYDDWEKGGLVNNSNKTAIVKTVMESHNFNYSLALATRRPDVREKTPRVAYSEDFISRQQSDNTIVARQEPVTSPPGLLRINNFFS